MILNFTNCVEGVEGALPTETFELFALALDAVGATGNKTFKIYRSLAKYSVELFDLAHVGGKYLRFIEALPEHSYFITNKDNIEHGIYGDYRYLDVLRKRYRDGLRYHGFDCACSYDTPESTLTVERLLHKHHDCKFYRDVEFFDGEILPDGVSAETARRARELLTHKVLNMQARLFMELLRLGEQINCLRGRLAELSSKGLGVETLDCQDEESRDKLRIDCGRIIFRWVCGGEQGFSKLFLEEIRSVIAEVKGFLKETTEEREKMREKMMEDWTPQSKYFYSSDNSDDNAEDHEHRYYDDRNIVYPPDFVMGEYSSDEEELPSIPMNEAENNLFGLGGLVLRPIGQSKRFVECFGH